MTTQSGPGRAYRKGLSLLEIIQKFDTVEKAEAWFIEQRWPDGIACPHCGSASISQIANRKPMPFRCKGCRKHFSVKTGSVLQSSNIPLNKWAIAFYLYMTNLKGVSSMKLHRDLGITQKTAWMMAQKVRECWLEDDNPMSGEIEVDETYIGGKERNKHADKKQNAGRGPVGKTAVVGAKQRNGRVKAKPVNTTDKATLQGFVADTVTPGSTVYTDDAAAYKGMTDVDHEAVKHSVGEYVKGQAHTNGVESFWAMLKRGYVGTYHKMSAKHLHRYVREFAGRANVRDWDTLTQMAMLAYGMVGKRMRYQDLTA